MKKIHFAFIFYMVSDAWSVDHRYCELESCPNRTHTLCKYPDPGPVQSCGYTHRTGLYNFEKLLLLHLYNNNIPLVTLHELEEDVESRHVVAISSVTVHYRMKWDDELAEIAQRWADQCRNETDSCRNVDRFHVRQRVGQHRTLRHERQPSVSRLAFSWLAEDSLDSWENINFDLLSVEEFLNIASTYFSYLMQRRAEKFGCGAVRSFDNAFHHLHLVCNYGPD